MFTDEARFSSNGVVSPQNCIRWWADENPGLIMKQVNGENNIFLLDFFSSLSSLFYTSTYRITNFSRDSRFSRFSGIFHSHNYLINPYYQFFHNQYREQCGVLFKQYKHVYGFSCLFVVSIDNNSANNDKYYVVLLQKRTLSILKCWQFSANQNKGLYNSFEITFIPLYLISMDICFIVWAYVIENRNVLLE